MHAAPRRVLGNLNLAKGRAALEVMAVIGNFGKFVRFDVLQSVRQRHVAVYMVMTIGFAIGCDMHQLRPGALIMKPAEQSIGKLFAVGKEFLECDRPRDGAVVKEEIDGAS